MALTKVTSPMMKGQTLTYQIPTDFLSLQAAVDALSPTVLGDVITLNIETGHKLTSGLIVENGDYTQFTITSTDATVLLAAGWVAGTALLTGTNARMPNWNIFVDCEGKNVNTAVDTGAINVLENSTLLLGDGAGCTNGGASNNGLFVYLNSKVTADICTFSNFPNNNIWVTALSDGFLQRVTATGAGLNGAFVSRGSRLYVVGSDFSGAAEYGILAFRSRVIGMPFGTTVNTKFNNCGLAGIQAAQTSLVVIEARGGQSPQIYDSAQHGLMSLSGSTIDAIGVDFKDIAFDAIRADTATVQASTCTFDNIGRDVINAFNCAVVNANGITATNAAGRYAINASTSSTVSCADAELSGAGSDAIICSTGSTVTATGATANNAIGNALRADGGNIVAINLTATGAGGRGAFASSGGFINISSSNLSGATTNGARAASGSRIVANGANVQLGGSPSSNDCVAIEGSTVSFTGGTGGTNITVNTLTASGIIFQ